MDKGYIVDAEIGFLLVADDKAAEELTAELMPLIAKDQQAQQAAVARAETAERSEPRTPPAAEIAPARGPAGSEVVVSGSGFTPAEVLFLWDDANPQRLPEIDVQPNGEFEITITVPKGLKPGKHTLSVEGAGSDVLELTFVVE